jgi:hypothetical protein
VKAIPVTRVAKRVCIPLVFMIVSAVSGLISEALPVLEAVANSAMGCAVPNGPQAGSVVREV